MSDTATEVLAAIRQIPLTGDKSLATILSALAINLNVTGPDILLLPASVGPEPLPVSYAAFISTAILHHAEEAGRKIVEPTPEQVEVVSKVAEAVLDTDEGSKVVPEFAWGDLEWGFHLLGSVGQPIPPSIVPHLWEAYCKIDDARTEVEKSAGEDGTLHAIAKAEKTVERREEDYELACLKAKVVALGVLDSKGKPYTWPCHRARVKTLRTKLDEALAALAKPPEPKAEEGANVGYRRVEPDEQGIVNV
jgi:hypothetical protein